MTLRRIAQEFRNLQNDPLDGCSAAPLNDKNLQHWAATITGSPNTPYKNQVFDIRIQFPDNYPHEPPQITFSTPIFHPNISSHGGVQLADVENTQWCPAFTIRTLLISLQAMLSDPNLEDGCVLNEEAAKLYLEDIVQFEEKTHQLMMIHAVQRTVAS